MSFNVIAAPGEIAAAATDVAAVGSTLGAAHVAAAAPTTSVIPAAADEVSASIAQFFSQYAQDYHAMAQKAAAFGEQFVQNLKASASSYASTEGANLKSLASTPNSPLTQLLAYLGELQQELSSVLSTLESAFVLPFYIVYELLVFSYLGLALLIGLIEEILKLLGVTIPIP